MTELEIPILCEQDGCQRPVETYCPLCERFLCQPHDVLVPVRCHDCLGGPADDDDGELLSLLVRVREELR
jgi:hypothetical protein